jgi:carbon-monoxide dehydrogenase small subunit
VAEKQAVNLNINGETHELLVDPRHTLLTVLREQVGLTGAKNACNQGVCGACTVLADGVPVRACLALAVAMSERELTTIEGLATDGRLHPVQQAFIDHGALQCGFCTPGMILAAKALLEANPHPTVEEVRHELGGNLCRCTGYVKIIDAVMAAGAGRPA